MSIKIGDTVPNATLAEYQAGSQPQMHQVEDLVKGKKIALFAVPGAFTPTCTEKHLPGFLDNVAAFKAKGVDEVWCVAVNDMFVMDAWGRSMNVDGNMRMLADGSADWTKKLGLGFRPNRKRFRCALTTLFCFLG